MSTETMHLDVASKNGKLLQQLEEQVQAAQTTLDNTRRIIGLLPQDAPEPDNINDYADKADCWLTYKVTSFSVLEQFLTWFPPVETVQVTNGGRRQMPRCRMSDTDKQGKVERIEPVIDHLEIILGEPRERRHYWYSQLAEGLIAKVDVRIVFDDNMIRTMRNHTAVRDYRGFGPIISVKVIPDPEEVARQEAEQAAREAREAPLRAWLQRWDDFATAQHYQARHRQFLMAVKACIGQGRALTFADLPDMQFAGNAVAFDDIDEVIERIRTMQTANATRKRHPWDRIGNFWNTFSGVQVKALLAFAQDMHAAYPTGQPLV